jgi:signal transduction histidine kinase
VASELRRANVDGAKISVSGQAPRVRADRGQLARAVHELLDNAVSHGSPDVEVALATDGDDVVVRVLDRGPSVAPELVPACSTASTSRARACPRAAWASACTSRR